MNYNTTVACGSAEMAPRSEHHAAMLVLEQRAAQLQKSIEVLAQQLEPALRSNEPKAGADSVPERPPASVQIVAHVDSVLCVVESCIQRVTDLDDRLVI